jgi:hypothetical protein
MKYTATAERRLSADLAGSSWLDTVFVAAHLLARALAQQIGMTIADSRTCGLRYTGLAWGDMGLASGDMDLAWGDMSLVW